MKRSLLFVVAVCVAASAVGAAESGEPDVLVILTDQWNPRYWSWDDPQVVMPHLDQQERAK